MAMAEHEEILALKEELQWLLSEEVHAVLGDIQQTLQECGRCFPMPIGNLDDTEAVPNKDAHLTQRILLSAPSTATAGAMKCVITLQGDCISEADISFKHKQAKEHHIYRTSIKPNEQWKIQQVQDAANHLQQAIAVATLRNKDYKFSSAQEVLMMLEELMKKVKAGQLSLTLPKRKSLQELVTSKNMQIFQPPVPSDVAMSFYVHGSKLVLAVYHLHTNGQHRLDISHRMQMEVVVQWLNEAIICFTLALQQCQQLFDKIFSVCQFIEEEKMAKRPR
ncbi:protein rogdi-like [Pomacea canaliculata]|uniref:protein rogdi-like n=1 Tax=Pomacea canaliculata TaxID=400727 RepID=UPI000D72F09A|nr:protein rogdi-like [Pomacea canaliculata]